MLVACGFAVSTATGRGETSVARATVSPTADAVVTSTQPSRSDGRARRLRLDATHVAYMSFNLPRLVGPLARASLHLYVASGTGRIKVVETSGRAWSESGLTLLSAPPRDGSGPLSNVVRTGRWTSIDVTPLVADGRRLTLALVAADAGSITVSSRESRANAPVLVIAAGAAQPELPLRAAFYYPWYPEAWRQSGRELFTRYAPSLGFYDSASRAVVRQHVEAMQYGGFEAGIVSWWGPGTETDERLPALLRDTDGRHSLFRWAIYYEREARGDPSAEEIGSDLAYVSERYARHASYLRLRGRVVVFVYAGSTDGCGMVDRWRRAGKTTAFVVLKVFPGYRSCPGQPDGWHQYAPGVARDERGGSFSVISPGFFAAGEPAPRLLRDVARWRASVRAMVASRAPLQLVTTFNEWGEGTGIESAREWETASGYGAYLDALHTNGAAVAPHLPPQGDVTIAAAGDIACDPSSRSFNSGQGTASNCRQLATSDLLVRLKPAAILTLGDTQYEDSAYEKFLRSFDPSWGRLKPLIRPAIGNHEYLTADADGYFEYFGAAAGARDKGYYSYDLGAWHLIALNSECRRVGGCHRGSPQEEWLRDDLSLHPNRCVLAYWHAPRFSSGQHGGARQMATIWNDLVTAGADVVLSGHNHVYERFEPLGTAHAGSDTYQSPTPQPGGVRLFVVGTGGRNHVPFASPPLTGEVVRDDDTYGVLALTLRPTSYTWRFVPEAGGLFSDAGSSECS
jgi:hypothetical protein